MRAVFRHQIWGSVAKQRRSSVQRQIGSEKPGEEKKSMRTKTNLKAGLNPQPRGLCVTELRQEPCAVTLRELICAGAVSNGRTYDDRMATLQPELYRRRGHHQAAGGSESYSLRKARFPPARFP
jgi:hypothetical protein